LIDKIPREMQKINTTASLKRSILLHQPSTTERRFFRLIAIMLNSITSPSERFSQSSKNYIKNFLAYPPLFFHRS
jgi:hypothetical protein